MLGFSPLASATIADDGATASIVYLINADGIVTGVPVVGQLSINASRRRSVHIADPSNNATVVTMGGNACIVAENTITSAVVTMGGNACIVAENTITSAVVTMGGNACILSEITPNGVTVLQPNEAA
jgi:hypothetical protein